MDIDIPWSSRTRFLLTGNCRQVRPDWCSVGIRASRGTAEETDGYLSHYDTGTHCMHTPWVSSLHTTNI